MSPELYEQAVAASERAGKLYMVSQSRRYNARLQALRQLVVDQIGAPGRDPPFAWRIWKAGRSIGGLGASP